MTPQSPKPSIHDVATGFMVPTSADLSAGFHSGFGTTTNIINGGLECGQGGESDHSQNRLEYYQEFLSFFGLPAEDVQSMKCGSQSNGFPTGGYGESFAGYFDMDWSTTAK